MVVGKQCPLSLIYNNCYCVEHEVSHYTMMMERLTLALLGLLWAMLLTAYVRNANIGISFADASNLTGFMFLKHYVLS